MMSLISLGAAGTLLVAWLVVRNEDRPVIKASDPGYLYMVLFSILLGFYTSAIPLFKPSKYSCELEYISFCVFAAFITSNLFWKCYKIWGIFSAANDFQTPKFTGKNRPNQEILLSDWLITSPVT